jgi:hypothetical protein
MYPSIIGVKPGDDYKLSITFENGESGTLDIKQYLDFGLFRKLKDPEAFKRVRVSFDTIEWESGVDLDPEFVYSKILKEKTAQQKKD